MAERWGRAGATKLGRGCADDIKLGGLAARRNHTKEMRRGGAVAKRRDSSTYFLFLYKKLCKILVLKQ
jgi:hypothetical protein